MEICRNEDGVTPLHIAAAWDRAPVVRMLLSYGGDPFVVDEDGKNAFHYAYENDTWDARHALENFQRTRHLPKQRDDDDKSYDLRLGNTNFKINLETQITRSLDYFRFQIG